MKLTGQGQLKCRLWRLVNRVYYRTQDQLWYNRFDEGREDAGPGRSRIQTTDENIETVKKMILDNRRITIRKVANE